MAHKSAFEHFLRTGEHLTDEEWNARFERKFNPNHDPENGQFTFARGGQTVRPGTRSATPARRAPAAPAPAPASRLRPIPGYPETGKDSWRRANDAIFEKAANDFNAQNGLKPGDARYMDPQLMKAWAMVESGGSREQFLSDPFQVNKRGDFDKAKKKLGLSEGRAPGSTLGSYAALRWLDMKGHRTTILKDGTKVVVYRGLPVAFMQYNGRKTIDKNGEPHYENYLAAIRKLYHSS
jgi:hypothetical protein